MKATPSEAWSYLRRSRAQKRAKSVPGQRNEINEDGQRAGYRVTREFVDAARSAGPNRTRRREDYERLVEAIKAGGCPGLALWESARGSRDVAEWSELINLCKRHGVLIRVVVKGRWLDPSDGDDRAELQTDAVHAEREVSTLQARVLRGKLAALREKRPPTRAPWGFQRRYDPASGEYVGQGPHPDVAPLVVEMYERADRGEPLYNIAVDFRHRQIPTPGGAPPDRWDGVVVRQVLRRPAYFGALESHGTIVAVDAWDAIVPEALWRRVNARLDDPNRRQQRGTKLSTWLSGVIPCWTEGCPHAMRRKGKYLSCKCGRSNVDLRAIEAAVWGVLRERLRRPDAALLFRTEGAESEDAMHLAEVVRGLEAREIELKAALSAPGAPVSVLVTALADLAGKLEAARLAQERVRRPAVLRDLTPEEVVAGWDGWDARRRRDVLTAFADVRCSPGSPGAHAFDPARLGGSRWRGAAMTWAEDGAAPTMPAEWLADPAEVTA